MSQQETTERVVEKSVTVTVPIDYRDQSSNPFLHTYHPDHDNLDPTFSHYEEEAYRVTHQRQCLLRHHHSHLLHGHAA